ncbi:hypothetical protein BpHYR1_001897 [Brachionus plicatilis]|uniref:MULE transposase domain-containing protein n=1 Tax=Brachionus plicatilis TaxID=10195 RepID=A0A3M7SJL2_BRAPC|nr:hypothetical protein BpHYR1_001897 [Brachionus plicatilis]
MPNPDKKDENMFKNKIKDNPPRALIRESQQEITDELLSFLGKKEAITKMIIRERNKNLGVDKNINYFAKCIEDLVVPQSLHYTKKDQLFYFDDSGLKKKDKSRVIIFTTESNLKLLNSYSQWYADGTFDISPSFFTQIYTIHIRVNDLYSRITNLNPLFTPKFQITKLHQVVKYVRANLVKWVNKITPKLIQITPEIHTITRNHTHLPRYITKLARDRSINIQHIQILVNKKNVLKFGNRSYRAKLQALAFLSIQDVTDGFKLLIHNCPEKLTDLLTYVVNTYIGKENKPARFPVAMWNLHERVKLNLPRTNNNVESWHSRIKPDARNNMSLVKIIELLMLEQSNMESNYAKVSTGEQLSVPNLKQLKKNQNIKCLVDQYDKKRIELFIDGVKKAAMVAKTFGLPEFLNFCTDFYFLFFRGINYIFMPSVIYQIIN